MDVMQSISSDEVTHSRWFGKLAAVRPFLTVVVVIAVLTLIWMAAQKMANEVSYYDLLAALARTALPDVLWAVLLTAISFLSLTVYDFEALAFVGRQLPKPWVALASFCAYAVGNTAGFGPLTAGAVRYRFYAPHGVEPEVTARIVLFASVAFGVGLTGIICIGFLLIGDDLNRLPVSPLLLKVIGALGVAGLLWLFWKAGQPETRLLGRTFSVPGRGILWRQFLATVVDVVASAAVLWVLLPSDSIGLPAFVVIFSVAIGLGVLSHVPAGLGVFETTIIAALGSRVELSQVLGALVLFRVIYHVLPLGLAALILTVLEVRRVAKTPMVVAAWRTCSSLAPPVLGAFTFVTAAVQIFANVTPLSARSVEWLIDRVPLSLVEGASFFGGVLAVVLLVVARGLVYRLDGAWWVALCVVPVSLLLALLRAAPGEALVMGVLLLSLWGARREFSLHASLLHQRLTPNWLLAVATLLITAIALLFYAYHDVEYAHELWWRFDFGEDASRSLRALLGVLLTAVVIAVGALLKPVRHPLALPSEASLAAALVITRTQPYVEANFIAMRDKALLFSDDGRAFIMYGRQGRSWVSLSDPIGPRECWPDLIWSFIEMARGAGGRPVFYQASPEALALYADAGLSAFKLGEEARIRLPEFSLQGSKRANIRNCMNRSNRDGLTFSMLTPEALETHLDELREVSDAWLTFHNVREKRFSLGAFDVDYVRQTPVGVLRQGERIVAFANVLVTDCHEEAAVDLMRFRPESIHGVMETLLVHLILHYQKMGYQWFRMGMAPLAGLSDSNAAPMWHRVGRMVFEHGEWFYNFSGLRTFKAKFNPEWQPRYLVVAGGINPMLAMADITVLVSGGLRGVIGK